QHLRNAVALLPKSVQHIDRASARGLPHKPLGLISPILLNSILGKIQSSIELRPASHSQTYKGHPDTPINHVMAYRSLPRAVQLTLLHSAGENPIPGRPLISESVLRLNNIRNLKICLHHPSIAVSISVAVAGPIPGTAVSPSLSRCLRT